MKIRELYMKNFGKFSDRRVFLKDGINLFYGENESGKTTTHTFIKSMLFGLERGKGRASVNDTFSIYEPWENPNYYAGVLRFESGGKNFCITRNFDKYGKSAALICEDDGEEFSLEHGDLEVLLNGLTAANYENTIAIGQMKVETNQSLAIELQNYATNYYSTGNSEIDLGGALSNLRSQKKEAEKVLRGLEREKEEKCHIIEQEKSFLNREIRKLEQDLDELKVKEEQQIQKRDTVSSKEKNRVVSLLEVLGVLLLLAILYFLIENPWNLVSVTILALAEGFFVGIRLKRRKDEKQKELTGIRNSFDRILWKKEHLQSDLQEKQIQFENLQEQLEELSENSQEYQNKEDIKEAIDIAIQKIVELSEGVHHELSIKLNERASAILKEITGGKYEKLFIDEKLKMSLYTAGRKIALEQVSRGTIEQIYFSLRMAASEILHEEEYPIILDDTFVYYDDIRLENTLRWIQKNKKQVIIFTCQKREQEILNRIS